MGPHGALVPTDRPGTIREPVHDEQLLTHGVTVGLAPPLLRRAARVLSGVVTT